MFQNERRRYSRESSSDTGRRLPLSDIGAMRDAGRSPLRLLLDDRTSRSRAGGPDRRRRARGPARQTRVSNCLCMGSSDGKETIMVTEAVKPMAGDVAGNDNGDVTDSRSLVDSLVASGALDPLFERIDGGRIELTGDGGLPGELTRVALERGLQAETTSHLGYAPGDGGVEGGRRACELAQRFVSQDAVHAGGRGGRAGSPRQGRLVRPEVGAQAFREAGRTGRDDHIPVRGRHDGARHPAPP